MKLYIVSPALDVNAITQRGLQPGEQLPSFSPHGPKHWQTVLKHAVYLSGKHKGADALVCQLFAITHDAARTQDDDDPQHGRRAALWLDSIRVYFLTGLTEEQFALLREAVADHADGKTHTNPTIGACWDSDRLDLPRVGIMPTAELLSTQAARDFISTPTP